MTNGRIILRVVLVVLLVGVCGLGVLVWWQRGPEYEWSRAQAAVEREDWEVARIHLQKLLAEDETHAAGHRELSRVYLAEGASSYAANPAAMNHLVEAAKLSPEDQEIQRDLMNAYLQSGRYKEASVVAERVLKADPDNADALFASAWKAVDDKRNQTAKELLDRLASHKSLRPFQTLALMGTYYQNTKDDKSLQEVLNRSIETAKQVDADLLASLSRREHQVMFDLFRLAVLNAPTGAVAHDRLETALEVIDRQAGEERTDLAMISHQSAEMFQLVNAKFPLDPKSETLRVEREQLANQAVGIWDKAIAADEASPLVYYKASEAAFTSGDIDRGLELIDKGLATADGQTDEELNMALNLHLLAARRLVLLRRFNDAEAHVSALIADEKAAGWGYLIAGSVASHRGELESALSHFLNAQRRMGNTVLVQMALSKVYISMQKWEEALPLLTQLQEQMSLLNPEQRAWASQQVGSADDLQFAVFRTRIGLDQWEAAQQNFARLVDTKLEPSARLLATLHLLKKEANQAATEFLAQSREKFPADRSLALLQARLMATGTDPDDSVRVMEDYVKANPEDFAIRAQMCNLFLSRKEYDRAIELLDKFEEDETLTDSQRLALVGLRCKAYLAQGKPEKVLELADSLQATGQSEKAALVITAAAQLFSRDLDSASQTLDQIAADSDTTPKLQLLRGAVAAAQGEFESSLELSAEALDVTSLRVKAESIVLRALEEIARKQSPAEALTKVEELIAKHEHAPLLRVAQVKLLIRVGRSDDAIAQLDSLLAEDKTNVAFLQLKAEALVNRREFDAALAVAAKSVEADPKTSLLFAARVALLAGKGEQALDYSQRALKEDPSLKEAYLLQADALMLADRKAHAEEVIKTLVRSHADWPPAHIAVINLHDRSKQYTEALAAARKAKVAFPSDFRFIASEVGLLVKLDKISEAEQVAADEFAKTKQPIHALSFAQTFAMHSVDDSTIKWAEITLAQGSDEVQPAAHLLLGNVYLKQSATATDRTAVEKARQHFAAVLESHPRHLVAGNNLAWLLADEFGEADEAVRICEQIRGATAADKLPAPFVDTMAMAYRKAKKLSQSESLAVAALTSYPNNATIHFQLGMTLKEGGRADEAKQQLQKAIDLGLDETKATEARQHIASLGS